MAHATNSPVFPLLDNSYAGSIALHERLGFHKVAHFEQVGRKQERWIDVGYWQRLF